MWVERSAWDDEKGWRGWLRQCRVLSVTVRSGKDAATRHGASLTADSRGSLPYVVHQVLYSRSRLGRRRYFSDRRRPDVRRKGDYARGARWSSRLKALPPSILAELLGAEGAVKAGAAADRRSACPSFA
jgi:hypothetical protein